MKRLLRNRAGVAAVFILLIFSLVRLYRLDGGVVLGEPDESIHQEVVENLKYSPWPQYSGIPWFFQMPAYPLLGYALSYIFPQKFVALRIVSVLSSVFLIFGTYLFFSRVKSRRAGFITAFLLAISPFSVYISRLALLDSTAVSFGFLFLYAFEAARRSRSRLLSLLSGIFLTVAVMVKYTALIYLLVLASFFLFSLLRDNWKSLPREDAMKVRLTTFLPLLIMAVLVLPLLYLMRRHDPYYFKLQTLTSLGFIRDFWRIKGGEFNISAHLSKIPWWLTLPVSVLFVPGLVLLLRNVKGNAVLLVSFLTTLAIVLPFRPFYPRYFYPLVPFAAIFAGIFLDFVASRLNRYAFALILLVALLTAPTYLEAFKSTDHTLVERTGDYIKRSSLEGGKIEPWLFTNYWPNIIGSVAGTKNSTWLTTSVWDAQGYRVGIETPPTEIFAREGGFVVLEDLYSNSKMFIHPPQRPEAWNWIEQNYKAPVVIYDEAPNFPHFRVGLNKMSVFRN